MHATPWYAILNTLMIQQSKVAKYSKWFLFLITVMCLGKVALINYLDLSINILQTLMIGLHKKWIFRAERLISFWIMCIYILFCAWVAVWYKSDKFEQGTLLLCANSSLYIAVIFLYKFVMVSDTYRVCVSNIPNHAKNSVQAWHCVF